VSDPARERVVAPAVAVDPEGAVHVVYYDLRDDARDYRGLEGSVWDGEWSLVSATSVDAGESFERHALVDDRLVPHERVMLIFTMPPPAITTDSAGRVITAWHDARHGDADIFAARSTDQGASWNEPVRLNDDARQANQYLPALAAGSDGTIHAAFFDRGYSSDGTRHDISYTRSADHGRSFGGDVRVTARGSQTRAGPRYPLPAARGQVDFGTGLAAIADESEATVAWPDSRNARPGTPQQEIFVTSVTDRSDDESATGLVPLAGLGLAGAAGVAAAAGVLGWWRGGRRRGAAPGSPHPNPEVGR
jgi:hypothetical protein